MEDPIILCLPIRERHIVIVWAVVICRLSETGDGKCLGCCDSSRMSHADSEIGKLLPFWAMMRPGTEGLAPHKLQVFRMRLPLPLIQEGYILM